MTAPKRIVSCFAVIWCIFLALVLVAAAPGSAQGLAYLTATSLQSSNKVTQIWMEGPFCVAVWWQDDRGGALKLCSEFKGADTPSPGASYKLDLPGPAWLALVGKDARGWQLSAIAAARLDMSPAPGFVLADGPTLVRVVEMPLTPSPPPSTATGTPLRTGTATNPPSPSPTLTPMPTPGGPPAVPGCATSITWYVAGDPAMGGLGGEVGSVAWCGACNRGCGTWLWGVSQAQMDEAVQAAKERLTR